MENSEHPKMKVFTPPMCSCCFKAGKEFDPIDLGGQKAYWFIFKELNPETLENTQSIDSILNFASEGFEDSEEAPDAKNYQQPSGQPPRIEFYIDTRKEFQHNFEKNLLCPICAQTFIDEQIKKAHGGANGEDGSFGGNNEFNPDGDNDRPWER